MRVAFIRAIKWATPPCNSLRLPLFCHGAQELIALIPPFLDSYLFRATLMTRLFMNRVKSLKSPCSIINGKLSSSNPESFLLIPQVTVTWNLKTANDLQKRHVKRLHNRFWYYFIVFNTSFQYFICPFAAEFVRTFNFRLIGTDHCGLFLKFC